MSFANYLIQMNIYLAVYFIFYKIFLSRETFFVFNRWFLLGALLTCLLLPFIKVDWFSPAQMHYTAYQFIASLHEVIIVPAGTAANPAPSWDLLELIVLVYWTGVSIAGLRMLKSLYHIYRLLRENTIQHRDRYSQVILSGNKEAFSFWRFLFTGAQPDEKIFLHEMVHIRQKHSVDMLLIELLKVFCWFNPFVYPYKKQLNAVHEYIADDIATRQGGKYEYAALLVSRSFGTMENIFIHTFFNPPLLKKRLVMLQKTKSRKAAAWKYSLSLPIVAALLFISSTTFALKKKINTTLDYMREVNVQPLTNGHRPEAEKAGVSPIPGRALNSMNKDSLITIKGRIVDENGNSVKYATVGIAGSGTGTSSNKNGYYSLAYVPVNATLTVRGLGFATVSIPVESKKVINILLAHSTEKLKPITVTGYASPEPDQPDYPAADTARPKVFTWVEQMPRYPGALNARGTSDSAAAYLRYHLIYPREARDHHIQGTVYVQFIVEEDGTLRDVRAVNSHLGGGLEEEAVRVVQSMPTWTPGRQNGQSVTVQYSIPVKFVLQ